MGVCRGGEKKKKSRHQETQTSRMKTLEKLRLWQNDKKPFSSLSVPLFLPRQFGEVGDDFGVAIFSSFWLVLSSGCKPKLGSVARVCLNSPLRGKCRRTQNVRRGGMESPVQSQAEGCSLPPLRWESALSSSSCVNSICHNLQILLMFWE